MKAANRKCTIIAAVSVFALAALLVLVPRAPRTDEERIAALLDAIDTGRFTIAIDDLRAKVGFEPRPHGDAARYKLASLCYEIAHREGEAAIPLLIGVLEADSHPDTIFTTPLYRLTDVESSVFHDGAWWRRWWDSHCHAHRIDARQPIPKFEPTKYTQRRTPFPDNWTTLQGKLAMIPHYIDEGSLPTLIGELARHRDEHAIPYLIGLAGIHSAVYAGRPFGVDDFVGHLALKDLTGVPYDPSHDAAWWRKWWDDNKSRYPEDVQAIEIPDYTKPLVFNWTESPELKQPGS